MQEEGEHDAVLSLMSVLDEYGVSFELMSRLKRSVEFGCLTADEAEAGEGEEGHCAPATEVTRPLRHPPLSLETPMINNSKS